MSDIIYVYCNIILTVHDTLKAVELIAVTELRVGVVGTEKDRIRVNRIVSLTYLVMQFQ